MAKEITELTNNEIALVSYQIEYDTKIYEEKGYDNFKDFLYYEYGGNVWAVEDAILEITDTSFLDENEYDNILIIHTTRDET